jgi:transcriptional regulator with XRE-family HTH domain
VDSATSAAAGTVAVMATVTAGAKTDRVWSMSKLQIRSIKPPLDDPETTDAAIEVLKSMEAMGLLPDDVDELTLEVIRAVATRAAEVGIGESAAASLRRPPRPPGHVAAALRELGLALEGSPMPAFEWPAMVDLFGAERLAELLGVSVASLRRYAKDERPTPDVVAARLHLLARIVAELRGAYSEVGVRRWFERTRTALRGRAPDDLLTDAWDPDGADAERVLALARALTASPAT